LVAGAGFRVQAAAVLRPGYFFGWRVRTSIDPLASCTSNRDRKLDRLIERTQRRSAFPDEFVQPFGCLPPITELVAQLREIADALLVARLAFELF